MRTKQEVSYPIHLLIVRESEIINVINNMSKNYKGAYTSEQMHEMEILKERLFSLQNAIEILNII